MLNPGDIVDNRFEVLALIGQGGLAEVFRVRHMELGSEYALKLLTWRREKLTERMVLEGRIQAQLNHPNIVSVVDLVRHEGQVGLLMEFVDGDTLEATILAGPTPVDPALRLFSGILAAVNAAHCAGVLHRDLKPANIMLARTGNTITPKVTDFGLAKVVLDTASGMTKVGMTMGTPGYLAPEQLSDASTAGKQADVFALGIILYELLTGTRAYTVTDDLVAVHATADEVPQPLHERNPLIPLPVCTAVQRAIERDPKQRVQSCAELAALLYSDHPSLLDQFTSAVTGQQVSLALNNPAVSAATSGATFAPATTLDAPNSGPPAKQPVGVWLTVGALGLLASLTALAAVAWVVLPTDKPEPEPTASAAVAPVAEGTDAAQDAVTDAVVDIEPLSDTEAVSADVPTARPEPTVQQPAPQPTVEAAPSEPDTEPAEPDTEAAEPDTEPPVVVTVAVTEPTPAPEPVEWLELQGEWAGTAGRQRMTLSFDSTASGRIGGRMTLALGPTVRTETLQGTLTPGGAVSFTAGVFRFSGRASSGRMSGTYTSGGRDRDLEWSAAR